METDMIKLLNTGYGWAGDRVARVRPTGLNAPTPCALWDVRAVLNHVIGAMGFMVAVIGDEAAQPDPNLWANTDLIGTDPATVFAEAARKALAMWRKPEVLQRQYHVPFGPLTGWQLAQRSLTDVVVHAWDISQGIEEKTDIPDELAEPLWEIDQDVVNESLRGGPFAPEVTFTGGSASDRLVAFLGRTP